MLKRKVRTTKGTGKASDHTWRKQAYTAQGKVQTFVADDNEVELPRRAMRLATGALGS